MKKIIGGLRYDTETATQVADVSNNAPRNDFRYEDTYLYVTQKGAFFLAGRGGPMSRWAAPTGDGVSGGGGIIPLHRADARALLEEHDATEELEQYFGDSITDA